MVMVVGFVSVVDSVGDPSCHNANLRYYRVPCAVKKTSQFKRVASPIAGAEVAVKARMHAMKKATPATKANNPQRMDIMRRYELSSRNNNE
jgi:hypothetical protein